jgi:hypothetical protein
VNSPNRRVKKCVMSFKMIFDDGFASWTENTEAPQIKPISLIYPIINLRNEPLPVCDRMSIVVRRHRLSNIKKGELLWENSCLAQEEREGRTVRVYFEPQERMPFLPAGAEICISAWSKTRVTLEGAIFFDVQQETRADA